MAWRKLRQSLGGLGRPTGHSPAVFFMRTGQGTAPAPRGPPIARLRVCHASPADISSRSRRPIPIQIRSSLAQGRMPHVDQAQPQGARSAAQKTNPRPAEIRRTGIGVRPRPETGRIRGARAGRITCPCPCRPYRPCHPCRACRRPACLQPVRQPCSRWSASGRPRRRRSAARCA